MDKSFDFQKLLRRHKSKPPQMASVAKGVLKRLQESIENRKSTRLTVLDSIRNLTECESPAPRSVANMKWEHRRQQLEKFKTEKELKKKEQAANKKKPFITGLGGNPMTFGPPPPPLLKPSSSGRVTRSQTKAAKIKPSSVNPTPTIIGRNTQSFAPKNASFKPPEMKNVIKLKLAPQMRNKKKASVITFDPVIPKVATTGNQQKVFVRQDAIIAKPGSHTQSVTRNTRARSTRLAKKPLQSSSSSDIDTALSKIQNSSRKSFQGPKYMTPKLLLIESTSSEQSSSNTSTDKSKRMSLGKFVHSVRDSPSSSEKLSSGCEESSTEKQKNHRKSLCRNFSPQLLAGTSSSDRISSASDVEIIEDNPPVMRTTRKSILTPKTGIPKSESSSEEKLRSPKSPIELALTPEQMESAKTSPYVIMSRGKDNARKEMKWKLDEGLLDEDASDMNSVDYFRQQLSSEIKRMTEMCDTWQKISEQTVLPEPVQEAVLSAVGQSRLLMSKKLQQFASLVERCAKPEPGAAVVTPADLQGFWDMVFMQVENIDLRFKKLEEMRLCNWAEEKPLPKKKAVPARPVAKKPAKSTGAPSRIREMIAAARKAKQHQALTETATAQPAPAQLAPALAEKTFDAGFFTVRSPVRAPPPPHSPRPPHSPHTPMSKPNLLKAVLSNEANKASNSKSSTPFAMLRASALARSARAEGVAPLPQTPQMIPVNLFATPGRSILKSSAVDKTEKKIIKIVLFHASECDTEEVLLNQSDVDENTTDNTRQNSEKTSVPEEYTENKENRRSSQVKRRSRNHLEEETPRRSSRNKKAEDNVEKTESKTSSARKRSTRKSTLLMLEDNISNINTGEGADKTESKTSENTRARKKSTRKSTLQKLDPNKSTDKEAANTENKTSDNTSARKRSTRKSTLLMLEDNISNINTEEGADKTESITSDKTSARKRSTRKNTLQVVDPNENTEEARKRSPRRTEVQMLKDCSPFSLRPPK